jgi:putative Ig domain-containing protein
VKVSPVCLVLVLFALLEGCSTAMKPDPPSAPSEVTLVPANGQAIDFGQKVSISASTASGTSVQGVNWALAGAGSLSGETPTSAIYNAPGSGNAGTATVTATSVTDSAKSASVTINVTPAPSVTTTSLPAGTQGTAYSQTVATSGGAGVVTLAISSGNLPAGLSMDSSGHIAGTPAGPSGTTSFTVKATDSSSAGAQSAVQNLSITVNSSAPAMTCGSGHESLLNGQYAFTMQGFDANGAVALGGMFDADGGGHIARVVGVEDINSSTGVQTNVSIDGTNSSYSVGGDNRGCLAIATAAGTSIYRFALGVIRSGVASKGRFIEFDNTGTLGSGVFEKQDPSAFSASGISGNYAFGADATSTLISSSRNRFAMVGAFAANGNGGITSGELDANSSGNVNKSGGLNYPASGLAFTGSYTVSSNGRGTMNLLVGTQTVNMNLYMVSASEVLFVSADPQSSNAPFTGSAQQQSGTPFSISSVSGPSVLYVSGLCASCGPNATPASDLIVGIFTVSNSGNYSFTGEESKAGGISSFNDAATVSVAPNGRVSAAGGARPPLLYLVSPGKAFGMLVDGGVYAGFAELQTGGPFTNHSANGSYVFGSITVTHQNITHESGVATYDGIGTVSGTSDTALVGSNPSLKPDQAFNYTYLVNPNGRLALTNGPVIYLISPTKQVVLNSDPSDLYPRLEPVEQ